jgi:hypothetical protein
MCRSRVVATAVAVAACCLTLAFSPPARAGRTESSTPTADANSSLATFALTSVPPAEEFPVELPAKPTRAARVPSGVVEGPTRHDTAVASNDAAPQLPPVPDEDDASIWTAIAEDFGREPEPVKIDWAEVHAEAQLDGPPPLIPLPPGAMNGLVGLGGLALIRLLRNRRRWLY